MIGAGFVLFFSSFYNDFLHLRWVTDTIDCSNRILWHRFNCSVDNNITITQRLPVGLGMASSNNSNGTTCATRYLYQPDSNSATSSGNINHSSSMNNYLNNYTDIVTTSNTSINWLHFSCSFLRTEFSLAFHRKKCQLNFCNLFYFIYHASRCRIYSPSDSSSSATEW